MQRLKFKNSRKLNLAATLYDANSGAIVIMAHGFGCESGKFDYIAQCLNASGYNILVLDFSGCGESDDDKITCDKQIDDLKSAIAFMQDLGYKRLALWGNSLGSRICVQAYSSEIITMVLTGALLGPVHYHWEEYFSKEQMNELAQKGFITQPIYRGPRRSVLIAKQMLDDFAEFDQQKYISKIACPVLVINGDGDSEELMLKEIAAKAMPLLSADSRHKIIPGASHSFLGYQDQIVNLGLSWLKEYMPPMCI